MKVVFWIGMYMLAKYIILPIIGDFLIPSLRARKSAKKRKKYIEKFQTRVSGEVVGEDEKVKVAWVYWLIGLYLGVRGGLYKIYRPIVRYVIGNCTYEVPAGDYSLCTHVERGRQVSVIYNPENPLDIFVLVEDEGQSQGIVKATKHPIALIAWCKAKNYKMQVVGEVVAVGRKMKRNEVLVPLLGPGEDEPLIYSAIVRYTVGGTTYEIDVGDYSSEAPIVGRKAQVWYNAKHPERAYVTSWRKYRKDLHVRKRDDEYLYCAYGFRKNIKISIEQAEERTRPGHYIVHRYGRYHLKQSREVKKSYLESMADVMGKNFDSY